MQPKRMTLKWEGTFIELCMGRMTRKKKRQLDAHCRDLGQQVQSVWYDDTKLIKRLFDVDNWWSIDDLDHSMGLVFIDRSVLETKLAAVTVDIDGQAVTMDPDAPQLSFYAPETIAPLDDDELVVCHGAKRQAILRLQADVDPPFDPSLLTLSFLDYPDYGNVLIDLDFNGHDDAQFTFGKTTYLPPRFFGKDHLNDTSR